MEKGVSSAFKIPIGNIRCVYNESFNVWRLHRCPINDIRMNTYDTDWKQTKKKYICSTMTISFVMAWDHNNSRIFLHLHYTRIFSDEKIGKSNEHCCLCCVRFVMEGESSHRSRHACIEFVNLVNGSLSLLPIEFRSVGTQYIVNGDNQKTKSRS